MGLPGQWDCRAAGRRGARRMGVILIILGLLCFPFAVNSPMYIAFGIGLICWGCHIHKPAAGGGAKPGNGGDAHSGGYEGRVKVDGTRFIYDDSGNLLDTEDGSFTESLDGVLCDNEGHVLERDDDGELRLR